MRTNSTNFEFFNESRTQNLRLVVEAAFATPVYFTSHSGIPNIPSGAYEGVLSGVSSVSQELTPDEGRSTIGKLSFSVIDQANTISGELRSKLAGGEGINEVLVRLYRGGDGMDWSDFRLEQTQQVDRSVELNDGEYTVNCSDIQRALRNDIYDLATTKLAAELAAGGTTLTVVSTADFEPCTHVASFGDQQTGDYFYLRIKYKNGFEIVRATGKTATTFTGLTRGMFGTNDITHILPAESDADSGVDVEEYVYLELPAPAAAYSILTGLIPGGGTIPERWCLGVDPRFVDRDSFLDIGEDWFKNRIGRDPFFDDAGGSAVASSAAIVGDYVLELDSATNETYNNASVTMVAGENLFVSAWASRQNTPDVDALFRVLWYDSGDSLLSSTDASTTFDNATDGWQYVSDTFTAPASTAYAIVQLAAGNGTTGEWHFDVCEYHVTVDYSSGLIFRFQVETKTDGKRFIEKEICLLAGGFMVVGADGRIGLRRMTGVIASADYVATIDTSNAYRHGGIVHRLDRIANIFDIRWSWIELPGEKNPAFVRRNILIDQTSVSLHGQQKPLELSFRGLHNERHTYTTLRNRFDAIRDRYAGPPIELDVDLLPHMSNVEVGDVVRVKFDHIQDFSGDSSLDRSFEIERIAINQETGRVSAKLFGSTLKASPIEDSGAGIGAELPDGWYSSEGTEMVAAGLTINGSGVMTANGSLTGGTDTREVFYYLGDLTINSGVTLSTTGNVELRVRGHLQINGTLDANGGQPNGVAGFIGMTYGGPGIFVGGAAPGESLPYNGTGIVYGAHAVMPVVEVENLSGVLTGIPRDMRGSGGGQGGKVFYREDVPWLTGATGGSGGAGGGSIVTVSRGAGYGVSGITSVSGAPGSAGNTYNDGSVVWGAGSGGGGAPGCLLHLLDGSGVTFPIIAGNVQAFYGTSPITNSEDRTQGKAKASDPVDLGIANARVAFVPKSRDPYPDYDNAEVVSVFDGLSVFIGTVYKRAASAPSTPAADDGSYNFSTNVLTPPSTWSATVPATDGNPLYASQATFSVQGGSGIDSTPTWSAPVLLVTDGADGAAGADGSDGSDGAAGSDGLSSYVAIVYLRSATTPATPTADDGSYNFGTSTLTPPSGWSTSPPAANGLPLWSSIGLFEIQGTSGTDETVTWSAPVILLQDAIYRDIKFQRNAAEPSTPTGDSPSGWYDEVPDGTDTLWQVTGTKNSAGTLQGVWSTPARISGLTFRGSYEAGTAYLLHDAVSYSERSYICVQAGTGNAPSGTNSANAYWDLLAGKGDQGDPATPFTETIAITGTGPVNLRTLADNYTPAYDGVGDATIIFQVGSGVTITGAAGTTNGGNGGHAINTGVWPSSTATIDLKLEITGTVRAGGGGGGRGGSISGGFGGGNAGDAIYMQEDFASGILVNSGGVVQAGGGGAGGGGSGDDSGEPTGGGGGGGGFPNGAGGGAGVTGGATAGNAGTTGGGGTGGTGGTNAGNGGTGGNVNASGASGSAASGNPGGTGGAAGYAVRKNGHTATVTNNGTITGTQG